MKPFPFPCTSMQISNSRLFHCFSGSFWSSYICLVRPSQSTLCLLAEVQGFLSFFFFLLGRSISHQHLNFCVFPLLLYMSLFFLISDTLLRNLKSISLLSSFSAYLNDGGIQSVAMKFLYRPTKQLPVYIDLNLRVYLPFSI